MKATLDGRRYTVPARCEVAISVSDSGTIFCGEPTTHFYPAMGGGVQSLCAEHAKRHITPRYVGAWPVEQESVSTLAMRREDSNG